MPHRKSQSFSQQCYLSKYANKSKIYIFGKLGLKSPLHKRVKQKQKQVSSGSFADLSGSPCTVPLPSPSLSPPPLPSPLCLELYPKAPGPWERQCRENASTAFFGGGRSVCSLVSRRPCVPFHLLALPPGGLPAILVQTQSVTRVSLFPLLQAGFLSAQSSYLPSIYFPNSVYHGNLS